MFMCMVLMLFFCWLLLSRFGILYFLWVVMCIGCSWWVVMCMLLIGSILIVFLWEMLCIINFILFICV